MYRHADGSSCLGETQLLRRAGSDVRLLLPMAASRRLLRVDAGSGGLNSRGGLSMVSGEEARLGDVLEPPAAAAYGGGWFCTCPREDCSRAGMQLDDHPVVGDGHGGSLTFHPHEQPAQPGGLAAVVAREGVDA